VPEGGARLRITLNAGHDLMQINALLAALDEAVARVGRAA
jgi:7-keto-8-aminopelargonate synthetase-like enzyme